MKTSGGLKNCLRRCQRTSGVGRNRRVPIRHVLFGTDSSLQLPRDHEGTYPPTKKTHWWKSAPSHFFHRTHSAEFRTDEVDGFLCQSSWTSSEITEQGDGCGHRSHIGCLCMSRGLLGKAHLEDAGCSTVCKRSTPPAIVHARLSLGGNWLIWRRPSTHPQQKQFPEH